MSLGLATDDWRLSTVVLSGHRRFNSPADGEVADDRHLPGVDRVDQIIKNLIGHVFVEDSAIAELDQVVLERLELDALSRGYVGDANLAEIGQAGLRAHGSELGTVDGDAVVPLGPRIREGLDRRPWHCKNSMPAGRVRACMFDSWKKGALRYAGFSEENRD